MHARLDPGDRKLLIVAGALLLMLTVASLLLSPPAAEQDPGFPTSYSAGSGGAKAAYLLLKELGYAVERWERSPVELPDEPAGATLILAQPVFPASAEERQAVHRFVNRGGHLLVVSSWGMGLVPDAPRLAPRYKPLEWLEFRPQAPSPLVEGAPRIVMADAPRARAADQEFIPVFGDDKGAVVVTYRYGQGRVTWWSSATPLTNAGITQASNLNLFLNSIGWRAAAGETPGRVLWDEYFHGRQGTLWTYFARTPLPWGLVQLAVFAVALFLGYSRRHGPSHPPEFESRLSPLEFVSTLGGLYQRARAAGAAVGIALQRFRYLLGRRLGVSPAAPVARLYQAARDQLGWKEPGLLDTLQRCERAQQNPTLSDRDALALVQSLAHHTQLLRLGRVTAKNLSGRKD